MSRLGAERRRGAGGAAVERDASACAAPGRKKLETDRRRIRDRVRKIELSIDEVRNSGAPARGAQCRSLGTIALVGYTNAQVHVVHA